MKINNVEIQDTFAEAWELEVIRLVLTAVTEEIALGGAHQFVGAAGSGELGSKINAGIERAAYPQETPDGRPGVIISLTSTPKERPNYIKEFALRVHLATLIPTCAVYDFMIEGVASEKYDISADMKDLWGGDDTECKVNGRDMCVVPTLPGDFKFEKKISIATKGSDGHLVCYGKDTNSVVLAIMAAKKAIEGVDGVCPMGFGLEQVYREKDYVPSLKDKIKDSKVPEGVGALLNLLVFGVDIKNMEEALAYAMKAACQVPGVIKMGAMNFNGEFGPYKFHLQKMAEKY
jgi:formylmethanofuran--tetrahydromethanopterin N-formyltransferase